MSFYDSERIRSKNRVINCAFEIYDGLYAMGYSAAEIKAHAQHKMATETDFHRNEIYLTVIDIAGRTSEKGNYNI
jgi:hypothetical protein